MIKVSITYFMHSHLKYNKIRQIKTDKIRYSTHKVRFSQVYVSIMLKDPKQAYNICEKPQYKQCWIFPTIKTRHPNTCLYSKVTMCLIQIGFFKFNNQVTLLYMFSLFKSNMSVKRLTFVVTFSLPTKLSED